MKIIEIKSKDLPILISFSGKNIRKDYVLKTSKEENVLLLNKKE